jgi:hypothetical protein
MATITLRTPDAFDGYPAGARIPMHEVRSHARRSGSHWFDADTMRSFGSRIPDHARIGADGRAYFVSSERDTRYDGSAGAWNGERRYTLRAYDPAAGSVDNAERAPDGSFDHDAFGRYRSARSAATALRAIVGGAR